MIDSFLVFSGIAPHPPIMVPQVGGDAVKDVRNSIEAMAEFTRRLITSGAETIVIISPHAPLEADAFVAYSGESLHADFARFRAGDTSFRVSIDEELLDGIIKFADSQKFLVQKLPKAPLDHGISVPLYFLLENGWAGRVVALGYSFLSNKDHLSFGSCVRQAIDYVGRRVALVASGDLSHRLKPDAPAGYNPTAHEFDEQVVAAIRSNDPQQIEQIDPALRKLAGECGFRSMLIAIGATRELPVNSEVLCYEAPFGVGYMVAQLATDDEVRQELPGLARKAVETLIRTGMTLSPPVRPFGILASRAPCFVTLKTNDGELRGCIGTIEASRENLAAEIIANAMSAATNDPRFFPINGDDLPNLRYSVDVLLPAEPATIDELDPKVYGVIVEDESGSRRGLLLPDIKGIKKAEDQVQIAARKADIPKGAPVRLSRFKVQRFKE
jgi:MEMO1 family protein